nr:recombinase family protein [Actinopolyspora halophila]
MSATIIGYARCSTDEQDLTAQQQRLTELGVADERIYLDHGLTGTTRAHPWSRSSPRRRPRRRHPRRAEAR